ncbi:hypothetical protein AKJ16_DCAP09273 [Drosera capensis]
MVHSLPARFSCSVILSLCPLQLSKPLIESHVSVHPFHGKITPGSRRPQDLEADRIPVYCKKKVKLFGVYH